VGLIANGTWDPWPRSSPQLHETPGKAFVVVTKRTLCLLCVKSSVVEVDHVLTEEDFIFVDLFGKDHEKMFLNSY